MLMAVFEVVDSRKKFTSSNCKDQNVGCYTIQKTFINTDYVLKAENDLDMMREYKTGRFQALVKDTITTDIDGFTKLFLVDGQYKMVMTVVGSPEKLFNNKSILNG